MQVHKYITHTSLEYLQLNIHKWLKFNKISTVNFIVKINFQFGSVKIMVIMILT